MLPWLMVKHCNREPSHSPSGSLANGQKVSDATAKSVLCISLYILLAVWCATRDPIPRAIHYRLFGLDQMLLLNHGTGAKRSRASVNLYRCRTEFRQVPGMLWQ